MKAVKWIRNGAGVGYGYFDGDTSTLSDAEAIRLRDMGIVLIIPDTIEAFDVTTTHVSNKPQNFGKPFKPHIVCR